MLASKYSAADAALGYVYQIRCALLYSLRYARDGADFCVGVESLDDVTFTDAAGDPIELLQTKHSLGSKSSLANASPELWKTLRIWIDGWTSGSIPTSANLFLITTGVASAGSAAWHLRADSRSVEAALDALSGTAGSSTNEENESAYKAFLALSRPERIRLLSKVCVIDAAPTIVDLDAELRREVRWSADKDHIEAFLEHLEGWWLRRVLRQLTKEAPLIESGEVELRMSELREDFRREALPLAEDILEIELTQSLIDSFNGRVFVRQIELVTDNTRRVGYAIRDYFRAYEQRSRWIRQDLVLDLELHRYEKRLTEEWEMARERVLDEMKPLDTEDLMKKAGLVLLNWAETTLLPIRKSVTEQFISRGSFHILADDRRVGWHPEFLGRLAALLSVVSKVTA